MPTSSFAEPTGGNEPTLTEVRDARSSVENLAVLTTATADGLSKDTALTILDSQGTEIFKRMNAITSQAAYTTEGFFDGLERGAFSLSFSESDVTYQSMTLLLTLPEAYRKNGYVTVLGVTENGVGVVYQDAVTAETDHITFYISGTNYPAGEFALLYNTVPVTKVQDSRTDTTKTSATTATISKELLTDRIFSVTPSGSRIQTLIDGNGSYSYDAISVFTTALTDDKGTPLRKDGSASDYGTISIQLAAPDAMRLADGRLKLFAVKEDGTLDSDLKEAVNEQNGTTYLTFTAESTGEYAICYFENAGTSGGVTVADHRRDCSQTAKTTASVPPAYTSHLYLTIEPSEGAIITPLIKENGTYQYSDLSAFTLTMTDAPTGGNIVSDFGTCTITMVLPDDMNASAGRIYLLGVGKDGTLNAQTTATLKTVDGSNYLTFETSVMTEYAILFDTAKQRSIGVGGTRADGLTITATITGDVESTCSLIINDLTDLENNPFYALIMGTEGLKGFTEGLFYDISIRDISGNNVTNFGTCTITTTLPETMDPDKGSFRVVTTKANDSNLLDQSIDPVISEDGGVKKLSYTTTHFTEYALLYTSDTAGAAGGSVSGNNPSSSTPLNAQVNAVGTDSTTTAAASDVVVNPGNTLPPAASGSPLPQGGTGTTGTADMPKTADRTTYRNVIVMILLIFGTLMLISSFRFEKKVRRRKV